MTSSFRYRKYFLSSLAAMALATLSAHGQPQQATGVFPEELFNSIQREMICLCGCKSILKDCPHVNCDYAIPARNRIREMLTQGNTRDQIIDDFVREKGEQSLAAPVKEGFNLLGYILPFLAILAAGYGVSILAARWAGRRTEEASATGAKGEDKITPAAGGEMAQRLKKELEEFDS
ncbi:MAG: cytochrome c-type biogenesis protein CcmH [Nitrospinota bacterium]|nr:cytochrome c-type biogenesis protein CcmH [Nitrospinota bacterium]